MSKWPTGYDGEFCSPFHSHTLSLSLHYSLWHYYYYYYDICVRCDGFGVFLCAVLRFAFLFCFLSYFILFKLLIKGFRQRFSLSLSRSPPLADSRLKLPLPPQPARAFIIYANFFCRVLCCCFSVSGFPLNALKSCS